MRTSIATVCISGSLEEKLASIARSRFDGIELFEPDLVASRLRPEEVRSRAEDLGLSIDLYQPLRDIEGTDDATLRRSLERAARKFELMARLGVDTVLLCSNVGTATVSDPDVLAGQLARLGDLAGEHGVRVAYEALAWGRHISTYDRAWEVVARADHPAVGLCLDSFHILSRSTPLEGIEQIPGDRIFYLQLADAPRLSLDPLSWSRHHRLFPGEGDWDLVDFTERVLRAGYSGPLSLEVFNDVFRQGTPAVTARDARRSLTLLEDGLARRAQPVRPDAVRLPDPPVIRDVSFLELDPGLDSDVADTLRALGFRRAGAHVRKQVELWEAGEVCVLVNGQLEGAAARLAALGVGVVDVPAAAARANALALPRVPRDERPGESSLPAVATPSGLALFFAEAGRRWREEFAVAARATDGPIRTVDHVALVQPWQRAAEAVALFEGLLDARPHPTVEFPSEVGLVSSRALDTPDSTLRLAVNVIPAGATELAEFVDHVALACDDIRAVVRRVHAAGIETLEVPDNYYDDLAARTALPSERIDDLARYRLLYDADERGEFLHAYLRPTGRVQFELVERRGDYRGFGSLNSPVRLAALRRGRFSAPARAHVELPGSTDPGGRPDSGTAPSHPTASFDAD